MCPPPFFCNFKLFNIKNAVSYHAIIQNKWMSLLVKGAVEPLTGGAGFYSNGFVVPKHTGGLQPILNLKQFNCYMHIHAFKIHTMRHIWQLF